MKDDFNLRKWRGLGYFLFRTYIVFSLFYISVNVNSSGFTSGVPLVLGLIGFVALFWALVEHVLN